jgi:hypothetical protein
MSSGILMNLGAGATVTLSELRVEGCASGSAVTAGIAANFTGATVNLTDVAVATTSSTAGIILWGTGAANLSNVRVTGTPAAAGLWVAYNTNLAALSCTNVRLQATTIAQLDITATAAGDTWNIASMSFGQNCTYFVYQDNSLATPAANVHIATAEFEPAGLTAAQIEAKIWHQVDNPSLGLVAYGAGTLPESIIAFDEDTQKFYLCSDGGDPAGSGTEIQSGTTYTLDGHSLVMTITGIPGDKTLVVSNAATNSLREVWYLRNGLLYRGAEYSTTTAGTFTVSHQRDMTYYNGTWYAGWKGVTHSLSWDTANSRWTVTAGLAQH